MLGFGLTLLGGCVSPPDAGGNRLCYFPAHSVTPQSTLSSALTAPNAATQENMKAIVHLGYFAVENIVKAGPRVAGPSWGFWSGSAAANTFTCSLCSRQGASAGGLRTHVQASMTGGGIISLSNILYESNDDLAAAFFTLKVQGGEYSVDSGFSEALIQNPLRDILADSSLDVNVYKFRFIDTRYISYDFVVSSYRNDGLGVNLLTLPLRSAPPSFTAGAVAVFEFQTQELTEL